MADECQISTAVPLTPQAEQAPKQGVLLSSMLISKLHLVMVSLSNIIAVLLTGHAAVMRGLIHQSIAQPFKLQPKSQDLTAC